LYNRIGSAYAPLHSAIAILQVEVEVLITDIELKDCLGLLHKLRTLGLDLRLDLLENRNRFRTFLCLNQFKSNMLIEEAIVRLAWFCDQARGLRHQDNDGDLQQVHIAG